MPNQSTGWTRTGRSKLLWSAGAVAIALTSVWFAWYQGALDPSDRKLVKAAVDGAPDDAARVRAIIEVYDQQVALKETGWKRRHGPWRYALHEYVDALADIMERDPASESARQAATWVIGIDLGPASESAVRILNEHHLLTTPAAPLAPLPFDVAQTMLERQVGNHTNDALRASAELALAQRHLHVETAARAAAEVLALDEEDHEVAALFHGGLPMVKFAHSSGADADQEHDAAVEVLSELHSSGRFELLSSDAANEAELLITRHLALRIGATAPEIVGTNIDGNEMRLSDFRGKVVVLGFWGDW